MTEIKGRLNDFKILWFWYDKSCIGISKHDATGPQWFDMSIFLLIQKKFWTSQKWFWYVKSGLGTTKLILVCQNHFDISKPFLNY